MRVAPDSAPHQGHPRADSQAVGLAVAFKQVYCVHRLVQVSGIAVSAPQSRFAPSGCDASMTLLCPVKSYFRRVGWRPFGHVGAGIRWDRTVKRQAGPHSPRLSRVWFQMMGPFGFR